MLKNSMDAYGSVAKFFHWVMAFLLICMFLIAYTMTNMQEPSSLQDSLYSLHQSTGLLIFGLVCLRLVWRLINIQPPLPSAIPRWQRLASDGNIFLLYFLMFAMPITGFLMSSIKGYDVSFYSLFTIPAIAQNKPLGHFFNETHEFLSYVLIAAFVLHLMGAFYHYYILKDNVLRRMWINRNNNKVSF